MLFLFDMSRTQSYNCSETIKIWEKEFYDWIVWVDNTWLMYIYKYNSRGVRQLNQADVTN